MDFSRINVTKVDIYPSIHWDPRWGLGPVLTPVLTGASGTYTTRAFSGSLSYELDVSGGTAQQPGVGSLHVGGVYVAQMFDDKGQMLSSPPMHCSTDADGKQTFTAVQGTTLGAAAAVPAGTATPDDLLILQPLGNISVTTSHPPAMYVASLLTGGTGNVVATRVGTPHRMGIRIDKPGDADFRVGLAPCSATGFSTAGLPVHFSNLTVTSVGAEIVLLQQFPTPSGT